MHRGRGLDFGHMYCLSSLITQETMDSVHRNLEQSRQTQAMLRALEARDRYLLEDNLWRVSFWSSVSLLVMVSVSLTQVYTLRRLFSDKHRVCT